MSTTATTNQKKKPRRARARALKEHLLKQTIRYTLRHRAHRVCRRRCCCQRRARVQQFRVCIRYATNTHARMHRENASNAWCRN